MGITLGEIAKLVNGELIGDQMLLIEGAGPIDQADERQITFAENGPRLKNIALSRAAAVIVPSQVRSESKNLVCVANPRLAFARVLEKFHPNKPPCHGIHQSAIIGMDCKIGSDVCIAAGVVIGNEVVIGNRVVLYPNVVIADQAIIGDDTRIYPHVTVLERCRVGERVIIHAGTVIGSDGYGFVQDAGRHVKIPQTGIVQIDSDVEIGAINTIDRATFGRTWIKQGVKTDNQVHIAHNVTIGEHSLIVAQVGISGSTTIGHHVILAGKAGIGGHIEIGNEVIVGGRANVGQSIPDKQVVSGAITAMPHKTWLRMNRILPNLPELQKQVRDLQKRIFELEKKVGDNT